MTEQQTADRDGVIAVSATGRVAAEPDVGELRLGVTVARPTVAAARADAASAMTAIRGVLRAAGVAGSDIRTTLLSVQPRYDYRDGRAPQLTGYELANIVEVTVRDLARLAEIIDGTIGAGATSLDGLVFRLDDPAPIEREARIRAMAAARERADVLAAAAGLTITGVADVTEGTTPPPPEPLAKARMMEAGDRATVVEAGTTEVAVTVTVSYRAR